MDRPEGGACLHPSAILQSRVPGADGPSTEVKGTLQGGHSGPAAMPILMESMSPGRCVHGAHGLS